MKFDLIVIGGGPGGYVAALEAARLGKTVALAEEREVGGTCLNRGCIPTKALLRAARVLRESREGKSLGVGTSAAGYDIVAMHGRAVEVTEHLRGGVEGLLARAKVTVLRGRGFIEEAGIVSVDGERHEAGDIIIATGSNPAIPPIPGIDCAGVVTSDELLGNGVDCKRLIIIGGGVVGVEFAQIYHDLGCEVTIIEAAPRLLPSLERELGSGLAMAFKKRGIEVFPGAVVSGVERDGGELICRYLQKEKQCEARGDLVLVSTGRRPNTAGLWAEGLGLDTERGFIPVDADGRTSVAGIWAIGDVVLGGTQLAHAAEAQGRNAVRAICEQPMAKRVALIPGCVFTEPEIATVGLTADEAKARGIEVKTVKNLTSANGKAVIEGADRGFVKLVSGADGQLLGAQLMCPHASEMIGGLTAAIGCGLTLEQLEQTVFPHPTVSETIIG